MTNNEDESLSVLAADEHLEHDAEREVRRKNVVHDCIDDHRRNHAYAPLGLAASHPTSMT